MTPCTSTIVIIAIVSCKDRYMHLEARLVHFITIMDYRTSTIAYLLELLTTSNNQCSFEVDQSNVDQTWGQILSICI